MKKILTLLAILTLFNISYGKTDAQNTKINTTFTFDGFVPTSADAVSASNKSVDSGNSSISYPVFTGNEEIVKNMNKAMEKFLHKSFSSKDKTYKVTYNITGSNDLFLSVLFNIVETDTKTNTITNYNNAISFNVRSGKEIAMKDMFLSGYNEALNAAIVDKVKQFGITTIDTKKQKFTGLVKNQKFYLEDDALVLFYNQGEATEFANGQLFIPFLLTDLIGIIK